jgi:hypothetical protein
MYRTSRHCVPRCCIAGAFFAVIFALAPDSIRATEVIELSDENLVEISARIFEGVVVSTNSQWNDDGDEIHTIVTFSVIQMIKGPLPPNGTIVLDMLGGEVDDVISEFVGQPTFVPGEQVIVFIDDTAPTSMPVTGLSQGKVTLVPDPATGVLTARERGVTRDAFVRNIARIVAEQGRR